MNRTLIVYQSKYGSVKKIAEKLALILGPAAVITPSDFADKYRDFDNVVIGSPIYNEQILDEIKEFIQNNTAWLKTKKIALFTVSLSPSNEEFFLDQLELLGGSVVWQGGFGGLYDPKAMDETDRLAMERFAQITGFCNTYINSADEAQLVEKAIEIKRILKNNTGMPQDKLRKYMEEFLTSHNTCTLCTGHHKEVRATPIEYMYADDALYFFTEGGEKFAHILVNPQVSVAVYDNYAGFKKLGGLQITGTAEIIDEHSEEYMYIASRKGLTASQLHTLPVVLRMIKVHPHTCEILSSEIGREGYDARQTLEMD